MTTPKARHAALAALAAEPSAPGAPAVAAADVPPAVTSWLAGLSRFEGVPVTYLVPDARMLPPESIRFFDVDPNWVAAMVDGAVSVAGSTAPQAAALAGVRATIEQAVDPAADGATACCGMVLRSALVTDWPGLQVLGYSDAAGSNRVATVRLERLAPSVLLALFGAAVARVDLVEPAQHLHFGVDSTTAATIALRWVDGAQAGVQLAGDPTVAAVLRPDPARSVLDVSASAAAIAAALAGAYQPQPVPGIGGAALAVHLGVGTQAQPFITGLNTQLMTGADR